MGGQSEQNFQSGQLRYRSEGLLVIQVILLLKAMHNVPGI